MMVELLEPIEREIESLDENSYKDYLNGIYGEIKVAGLTFSTADIIKKLDPVAFRCGLADVQSWDYKYECPICGYEYDEYEEAKYCCQEKVEKDEENTN